MKTLICSCGRPYTLVVGTTWRISATGAPRSQCVDCWQREDSEDHEDQRPRLIPYPPLEAGDFGVN